MNKAVFTIVHNESLFLPIWLKYYSQHFRNQDIFILDHETSDGSTDNLKCNVKKISNKFTFDSVWLRDKVVEMQRELLENYDVVTFTEVDEFIIPINKSLEEYIDDFEKDCICCKAYHIIHIPVLEPIFDMNRPVLFQRKYWYRREHFDKPLISKIPLNWVCGFHTADECREIDENLILLHIHKLDFELTVSRHLNNSRSNTKDDGMAWHNKLDNREDIIEYYYNIKNLGLWYSSIEKIPDWFPKLI